jgi:hypothetical protein
MDRFSPNAWRSPACQHSRLCGILRRPIFEWLLIQETTMEGAAVGVYFDSAHLFLDLSDGQAVQFPLDGFPVLQAATTAEREHFAISMDRQQLFWPEIDEDVNVPALLSYRPETVRQ